MNANPLVLFAAICLAACSSSGDRVESSRDLVVGSEAYTGPPTAAVTLVADGRASKAPYDIEIRAAIQRSIQQQLDRSGIFAGVVALERLGEENEAEVIIEPILEARAGPEDAALRVRVTEKTNARLVLEKYYEGGGRADGIDLASRRLEEDLRTRYGR